MSELTKVLLICGLRQIWFVNLQKVMSRVDIWWTKTKPNVTKFEPFSVTSTKVQKPQNFNRNPCNTSKNAEELGGKVNLSSRTYQFRSRCGQSARENMQKSSRFQSGRNLAARV